MLSLWRDVRVGFRSLWKKPGFTVASILLLALGIGANTAIFTLFDALFLHPIPVREPETLLSIYRTTRGANGDYTGFDNLSHPDYLDFRDRNRTLSGLALFQWSPMNLSGGSEPARVTGMFVTANYFDLLGLAPSHGRFFSPEEDATPGTHPVAVLSHGCFSRLFGADPGVLGRKVLLNGQPLTVVGVAPKSFKGTEIHVNVDLWTPAMMFQRVSAYPEYFTMRGGAIFRAFGRLRPGVTPAQADADLMAIARQLAEEHPEDVGEAGTMVMPFVETAILPRERADFVGYARRLAAAVVLILLAACVNVANLLLVRGMERSRETAVCLALGANRPAVVRRLLAETFLLFLMGGLVSLPVGVSSLDLLWSFRPPELAHSTLDRGLDVRVLGFALALTLATALLSGLAPALRASRPDLLSVLKEPALGAPARRGRWRPRNLLVAGQLALALVSLLGTGLLLRGLESAQSIELGFRPEKLIALTVAPGDQGYDEKKTQLYYRRLLERVEALPGVEAATLTENRLLRGAVLQHEVYLDGSADAVANGDRARHRTNSVAPGFFDTVAIPLLAGRDLSEADCETCPQVVVINRTMAESLWPGESAIGKRIHLLSPTAPPVEVVGVAENAKYRYLTEGPEFFIYLPLSQRFAAAVTLHARAAGDPDDLLAAVRREVQALDPNLPLADVETMASFVHGVFWLERISTSLLGLFGVLSLLLALVGVYGMMARIVAQRRREIGLRIALGASRADVLRVILNEAAGVIGLGVAGGWFLGYFVLAPLLASQLHGVDPADPLSYIGQGLLLAVAALTSSFVTARRGAGACPALSLRAE